MATNGEARYTWDAKDRGEAVRPFRMWDHRNKKNLPYRCYGDSKRAHNAALVEIRWAHVGDSIELYDVRTQRSLGTYTRRVESVDFTPATLPRMR